MFNGCVLGFTINEKRKKDMVDRAQVFIIPNVPAM
jgi:hypothetical protein